MKEFSFSDEKIKEKAELMLQEQNQKHRNDLEGQPWHRFSERDDDKKVS
jgi:hypothetical protein